jgi:hypothetical protein
MSATQNSAQSSILVPWWCGKEKVYVAEVRICDDLINRIQVTAVDITGGQFFVRDSRRQCEACVQMVEDTSYSWSDCVHYIIFSLLTTPNPTNRKYSKRSRLLWGDD